MKTGIHWTCIACLFALGCGQNDLSEGTSRANTKSTEKTENGDATETPDDSKVDPPFPFGDSLHVTGTIQGTHAPPH